MTYDLRPDSIDHLRLATEHAQHITFHQEVIDNPIQSHGWYWACCVGPAVGPYRTRNLAEREAIAHAIAATRSL